MSGIRTWAALQKHRRVGFYIIKYPHPLTTDSRSRPLISCPILMILLTYPSPTHLLMSYQYPSVH
jgi:hypothetical protein